MRQDDSDLRQLFERLRAVDREAAPSFDVVLGRTRRVSPWMTAIAVAALATLVAAIWPAQPAMSLSQWQSPTASLLEPPAGSLLAGLPALGWVNEEVFQCEHCF